MKKETYKYIDGITKGKVVTIEPYKANPLILQGYLEKVETVEKSTKKNISEKLGIKENDSNS